MRTYLLAIVAASLAGCGASDPSNEAAAVHNGSITATLEITSDAFRNDEDIPAQFTCDGEGKAPTLHWGEAPHGTKSFALVVDDPDAPSGTFRHWGVFDIPASARSVGGAVRVGTEVANDFGKAGYGGPCPPKGHGVHHYHFRLFALDTNALGLSATAKVADVERAAREHAIAEGELVGTYERR